MILGLNKDLERALKDKEKYRKKMKEVMAASDESSKRQAAAPILPRVDVINGPMEQTVDIPASPSNLDSDSLKNSPVDMTMAPYPITPPADRMSNPPPSAVGEILNPSHAMPKASEHALNNFDREGEDRAAEKEQAKKAAEMTLDLPIQMGLPPAPAPPTESPRIPPPKPPVEVSPKIDQSIASQFPAPSAPPPRKPPPAPLQLKKEPIASPTLPPDDDNESDSDFDDLLEVNEIPIHEKRGRRRTREEDDRVREILAQQEAERRSLSKKSKKGSQKGTPVEPSFASQDEIPASPRMVGVKPPLAREETGASLAGVLKGQGHTRQTSLTVPATMNAGLPASPRPGISSPFGSPQLSPRVSGLLAAPLSPRPPNKPIPLPLGSPLDSPLTSEPPNLSSPKPLTIVKSTGESTRSSPPASRDSPIDRVERTKIFKGFITEEYPDLLLPPNALPSIEVKVASSRMKPSRASLISLTQLEEDPVFTLAVFSRSEGGELWRVEKDIMSLAKLDQRLKQCPTCTAKTPDRSLFGGHAPAKLDARRIALNQYFDELLTTPFDTATGPELCKYLSTNTLPPNSDDTTSITDSGKDTNSQKTKTGPGGRPLKNGYLTKRGKNFGGWKARFFVLDGPHLKYYETPGGAHLGTIKLQKAQIGKQSQQPSDGSPARPNGDELDNQYRHAFLVLEPKKKDSSTHVKHVLCAESDKERDQWVDALLRWIDYKDPEEEGSRTRTSHDRSIPSGGSGSGGHVNGKNAKQKMYGQQQKSNARASSQDALIGISYEGTKQGDIPDGAPSSSSRRRTESQDRAAPPPQKTISAPRNPQPIADSSSWGSKPAAAPALAPPGPSLEEKKARKRSFFGFGPKTRSLSDDQDTLYGGSSDAPSGNTYNGPVRQVFGAPLVEAVRFNGPAGVNVPLPAVVYRCIQYLDVKNAILEEGIFRLSGSNVVIKQLRERFNTESDVNLVTDETYYDIHAVASLLKLYLRELPTTILTRDLHMQFLAVTEMSVMKEKIAALAELVQLLPQANGTLLRYLIAFLIKVINHADMNKMTVRNVGIVFSPTLNIPAPVFAMLLQNYEGIFGIQPEEYQLPTPGSDRGSRPPLEVQPRRPSNASLVGVAASPHRRDLTQQHQQQRSTPTPPPAALIPGGGLRPAPTPPPAGPAPVPPQQAQYNAQYDPQYLGQQQSAGYNVSTRPAYEGGYIAPSGYDPTMMPLPSSRNPLAQQQPNYERPIYRSSQHYDQAYISNRRESSMMNGGPKSRLREESRM